MQRIARSYSGHTATGRGSTYALVVLALILYGLSSVLHLTPSTAVVSGDELRQKDIDLLVSEGLLEPGENVILFYSEGVISIREGGNILTEERVISYYEEEGELVAAAVPYAAIDDVVVEYKGDFLNDTVVAITTQDGMEFRLLASTEGEGDITLIEELRKRWKARR
jgi:hypothetical protein